MPWWMIIYITLFALLLGGNTVFWIKSRGRLNVLLYELFSGCYLIFVCFAFWCPVILKTTTIWVLLLIPPLLLFECYYSIWGNVEDLLPKGQDKMSDAELESARGFSVAMASPAYLTAAKLFFDTFIQK